MHTWKMQNALSLTHPDSTESKLLLRSTLTPCYNHMQSSGLLLFFLDMPENQVRSWLDCLLECDEVEAAEGGTFISFFMIYWFE